MWKARKLALTWMATGSALGTLRAQYPAANQPGPVSMANPRVMASPATLAAPAPWLPIRWILPEGSQLTSPRDTRPLSAETRLGLRPGYRYRFELESPVLRPGETLYPTLEVFGCVRMPPSLKLFDHPAAVVLTTEELKLAAEGKLISKLLYLESNEAAPTEPKAGLVPPQTDVPTGSDLFLTAKDMGRPVARLWLGSRKLTSEEFSHSVVPGSLWRSGDPPPGAPALPPQLPCLPFNPADPRLGLKNCEEEIIHDGGDRLERAAIDNTGRAQGVNPEDAVAEFTVPGSRRYVLPSNRVCIFAPRYAWLRQINGLDTVVMDAGVRGTVVRNGPDLAKLSQPSSAATGELLLDGIRSRERASGSRATQTPGKSQRIEPPTPQMLVHTPLANLEVRNPGAVLEIDGPMKLKQREGLSVRMGGWRLAALQNEEVVTAVARVEQGPNLITARAMAREAILDCKEEVRVLEQPLILHKWADKCEAGPGDFVTFTLRLTNQTGKALADVAIVDNLSGRLEFDEGSANCSRDAVFLIQENEVRSSKLRWEITGLVQPGETVVVRFRAKAR